MKKIIRLTESDLHTIIKESVMRILKEDGLGGATNCAGVYDTPSSTGSHEGGNAQRKEVTNYPIGGVIRKPSPVGKKTKKKDKNIIKPTDETFSREGGFSVNGKAEWNVNEGKFGNALRTGALGAMMMFGGNNANAQGVNNRLPSNDSIRTQIMAQQNVKFSEQDLIKMFPQAYKDRNANPRVWAKNQVKYVGQLPNGRSSLVGKIAASYGENPWQAIVQKYKESDDLVFQLKDFDIQ